MQQQHHGWPPWVDQQLSHLHLRVHYLEVIVDMLRRAPHRDGSPEPKTAASISAWKELLQAAGALSTTLRWVFVILVVLGIMFKRISLSDLPFFKALAGG